MSLNQIVTCLLISISLCACSDDEITINPQPEYPSYGAEIDVDINGLTFDAMEPFISSDSRYLFFNNKNDGINTKLFYASKIDESTFKFEGELTGANQTTQPYLDAVADMDSNSNFFWTSTRNYPNRLDNLFYGVFNSGSISNIQRLQGNFYKNIPGWLIMDHGISSDGQYLYYINTRFDEDNCMGPCETQIGIAKKSDATTFNKIPNADTILKFISDQEYIFYAPCISSDDLELYYTRYKKGEITENTTFEICVAVRNNVHEAFSKPKVLFTETLLNLIEAPSLTTDKKVMYYHRRTSNSHKIVMRYRK